MKSFTEFMNEEKKISRWTVLIMMLAGCFCGIVLAFVLVFAGLVH